MSRFDNIRDYVLSEAADDWISLGSVAHHAGNGYTETPGAIDEAIRVLCDLVGEGLGRIGDISYDGFIAWEIEEPQLENAIRATVKFRDRPKDAGAGVSWVWYANTRKGNEIGERLLADERLLIEAAAVRGERYEPWNFAWRREHNGPAKD